MSSKIAKHNQCVGCGPAAPITTPDSYAEYSATAPARAGINGTQPQSQRHSMQPTNQLKPKAGQGTRLLTLLLTMMLLFASIGATLQAGSSGGPEYRYGAVFTRGVILGPSNQPIYVEYEENGAQGTEIGEAVGPLAHAHVMATEEYRAYLVQLAQLQSVYPGLELVTKTTYDATAYYTLDGQLIKDVGRAPRLADTTVTAALRPQSQRLSTDPDQLVLMEMPINPSLTPKSDSLSMLLDKASGAVLWDSRYNIGYKTGYGTDAAGNETGGDFHNTEEYHGALSNITVRNTLGHATTNETGRYGLEYPLPPCPGFYYKLELDLHAELYYKRFNPRGRAAPFPYYLKRDNLDICNGMGDLLGGMTAVAVQAILSNITTATVYERNFIVDLMVLAGQARLGEPAKVGPDTRYDGTRSTLTRVAQSQYDFDGDSVPDKAVLGRIVTDTDPVSGVETQRFESLTAAQNPELQGVWLSSRHDLTTLDITTTLPDLTRLADWSADFADRGLLSQLTLEDLRNTDLFVFRESDGTLITERHGLKDSELTDIFLGVSAESGTFHYTIDIVGTLEGIMNDFGYTTGANYQQWQISGQMNPKFYQRRADHLRPGERVRIVAINRASGYTGSITTEMKAAGSGGSSAEISFPIKDIILGPPNLKVWAERSSEVEFGLTKGEKREQAIGNEGAGMTDDTLITIYTEWLDQDGRPLPEALADHGYTGRLAKVIAPNTLAAVSGTVTTSGSSLSQFAIKPGRQTQVIRLPENILGEQHFYVQVSGEPISQKPDFSTSGLAENATLQYRPDRYVPFKTPIFDEEGSLLQQQAYRSAKADFDNGLIAIEPEQPEPFYQWAYRPEFQFSLYSLLIKEAEALSYVDAALPTIEGAPLTPVEELLDLLYSLDGPDQPSLTAYGYDGDRELVFALGDQEIKVTLGADQSVRFDDPSQLAQVDANDLLTLQLYSNNDAGNILYEYQGLPLFESYDHVGLAGTPKPDPKEVETMALSRSYNIGAFESSNAGLTDITDSYKLESFRLDQTSDVSLELLDRDGTSLGHLIAEKRLSPGFYHFVVTYTDIITAGITPRPGTDFVLRLTAIEPGSSIKIRQEKDFYGNLRASYEGRMLGQILQHNVLIQDGSLSLQREELKLPGVGPELSFSRSYTNKGSDDGVMGQGWGHNLDITLKKLAFADDGGVNHLPDWVTRNRGRFFKTHGEGGALSQVSVSNGGLFKWTGTAWESQRGRHGRLEVVADGIDYFAKDGTRYHFPNSFYTTSEVAYIEDPNGNRLDFSYEDTVHPGVGRQRRLTQVVDQAGRSLNFEYQDIRLVRVSSSEGQSLRFEYDPANNQLVHVYREDAVEREELYTYESDPADGSWNLTSTTDGNGNTTQYAYYLPGETSSGLSHFIPGFNDRDLIKSVTYADAAKAEFGYDISSANRRTVTDLRGGNPTTYELNFYGNPKRIEEPLGKVTTMAWSIDAGQPDNVMLSRIDAEGRPWSYQYDANGNVTRETDPTGETTYSTWHPQFSLLTERTDRNGHTISNDYDTKGNLIKSFDGEGNDTIHTYNAKGLRETTLSPRKFLTTYTYDSYGLPKSVTGPEGSFTQTQYNGRGLLENRTDANGNVTRFQYDALGQLIRQTDPDWEYSTYDYDAVGNKTDETNRYGLHLEYTYDARNRVTKTTRSGLGIVTADKTYDYDENGNLTEESDWKGVLTAYTYNALNQRITTTDRAGNGLSATYDLVGNKLSDTDQLGQLTEYVYDDLDRLITTTQKGDGSLNLITRNGYDKEGNLTSTTDAEGRTTTYGYDKRNLKTRRTNVRLDNYIWAYDASGNLVSETNEEGALTEYGYDKQERRISQTRYLDLSNSFTTLYEYDDNGNLTKTTDPRGNRVLTDYDALNRPILITDQDDFQTTIAYSNKGLTSKVTDARVIERTTSKNILEQLILETQGDGGSVSYTYDLNGNLATRTDGNGNTTRTEYDQLDRPFRITEAVGSLIARTTTKTYDLVGNLKTQTNGRGHITTMDYDSLNRLIQITDPAPLSTTQSFTYDDVGNKLTETNRRGHTTSYVYDNLNRLTLVTDPAPLSSTQSFTYDKVGNRLTETDRRSHTTTHSYDALNRLTQSEKPDGQGNTVLLIRNEYDGNDNLTAITDANGNRTVNAYNARNLLTTVTYADLTQTIRTYDPVGNLATETDEASQLTSYTYDNENRLASTTNPASETERYAYDYNGNRTSLTRPLSNGWSYQYDALNRLSQVSNALSHTTSYEYDADGNQTAHVDAESKRVEYQYDELSRRTTHIQKKGGGDLTTRYGYDANGNLSSATDALGRVTSYSYDVLNRQIQADYPVLAGPYLDIQRIVYQYDGNSNLTQVTETKAQSGSPVTDITSNSYDWLDRQLSTTQRSRAISYQYDANGNRTQVSSAGGTTDYVYNNRNRLTTATAGGQVTTYTYTLDGKKESITYPNATKQTYQYDPADRISRIQTQSTADSSVIAQFDYTYDDNGNRQTQQALQNAQTESTSYHYDNADRLTSFTVTHPDSTSDATAYTLDGVGNRLTETVTDETGTLTTDKTYSYDDTHWLTQVTDNLLSKSITYSYDANGNTLQKLDNTGASPESTLFAYDVRNQLVQTKNGPPSAETSVLGEYDYNYQGMRVRHHNSARGDIDYFYDDKAVLEERDSGSSALVAHYRYADRLLSLSTGSDTQYYHHDALGSTTHLSKTDGTTQVSYRLDPWGHVTEQVGSSVNRQVFTGQEHDENTNLIYFGARYYDPDAARFLNQDSYLGEANTPPSLHRYLYANANPLVYVDLYGFASILLPEERKKLEESANAKWYQSGAVSIDRETGDFVEEAGGKTWRSSGGRTTGTDSSHKALNKIGGPADNPDSSTVLILDEGDDLNSTSRKVAEVLGQRSGIYSRAGQQYLARKLKDKGAGDVIDISAMYRRAVRGTLKAHDSTAQGFSRYVDESTDSNSFSEAPAEHLAIPAAVVSAGLELQWALANDPDAPEFMRREARGALGELGMSFMLPAAGSKYISRMKAAPGAPKGTVFNSNGGVDFAASSHLYPVKPGQNNIVTIEYTGSRARDFGAANRAAGLGTTQKPPSGYTWHHLDDYDPVTNTGTLQLVKTKRHESTYPHAGGVSQYEKATGIPYDLSDEARANIRAAGVYVPGS